MSLPTVGTTRYGSITFNEKTRTSVSMRAIKDEAERTVKYVEHTLTVEGWITPQAYAGSNPSDTDDDVENLRAALMTPGQQLVYSDKGFGDLEINTQTTNKDVLWGPFPVLMEWQPTGRNRASFFKWQVQWHAPYCAAGQREKAFIEWNYDVAIDIDDQGLTTRTITGHAIIAMNRTSPSVRTMKDTADAYLEQLRWPVPVGFKRTQKYHLDKSKSRLDFTFTDTEVPSQNPLPDGVTMANVRNSISATGRGQMQSWIWRLSGTIRMAANEPTVNAYSRWMLILRSRLAALNQGRALLPRTNIPGSPSGGLVALFPTEQHYEEDVFGLESRFSITIWIAGLVGTPAQVLQASGLWTPILGTDWVRWNSSLETAAHAPRGRAQLKHSPSMDVIVDLCQQGQTKAIQQATRNYQRYSPGALDPCTGVERGSYAWYENDVQTQEIGGRIHHTPLASGATLIEHVRHNPQYRVVMVGMAIRLGLETPCPELRSVNGNPAKRVGQQFFASQILGNWCGMPIFVTRWRLQYRVQAMRTSELRSGAGDTNPFMPPATPAGAGGANAQIDYGS